MTEETWKALAQVCALLTPLCILISRLFSHFEHKKTEKKVKKTDADITQIRLYINGELAKKIEEAKEEGRQEQMRKQQNK